MLDEQLATDALAAGKELAGLETAVSQLEAMASLPMSLHIDGLVETLRLGDRMRLHVPDQRPWLHLEGCLSGKAF